MGCAFSRMAKPSAMGVREYDESGNGMYTYKAKDQTPTAAPSWKGREPSLTFRVNQVDGTYFTSQAYDQRRDAAPFQMSSATLDWEQDVRKEPTRHELAAGGSEYYNDLRQQQNLRNGKRLAQASSTPQRPLHVHFKLPQKPL